jgi:nucleoid-associated protein YgaU
MKKIFTSINKKHLVLPVAALFFFACQVEIPIKELTDARAAIQSAKDVNADRHSPDEFGKAEALVRQAHDEIVKEDTDAAKKSALDAIDAAKLAESRALPLFAGEKISAAEAKYSEAEKLYAEKFSPAKLKSSGELIAEAKTALDAGEYRKAASLADQAAATAGAACDDSLGKSSTLDRELSAANEKHRTLKNDKMSSAATNDLSSAESALTSAKKARDSRDLRTAYSELEKAKAALVKAENAIKKQKLAAEITTLRSQLNTIKKDKNSAAVAADIDNAMLELKGAETALNQNNINSAETRIRNAKNLIARTEGKLKKGAADDALANAEKMLATAKQKDSGAKYSENLGRAEALIRQGKSLSSSGNYNDAIVRAEEAETIIAAVMSALESEAAADVKVAVADGTSDTSQTSAADQATQETQETKGNFYTVKWRKKDTDCLWRISKNVYDDASLWPLIYVANRDQIKNPDLIFPGQKFRIPPRPEKKPDRKELNEMIRRGESEGADGTPK